MPIPFDVPARFAEGILSGQITRYGAILKDVSTGQIVGHLQETGFLNVALSQVVNPITSLITAPSSLISNYQIYRVDKKIMHLTGLVQSVQTLQFATLGVASLGLGINVASFLVLNRKLDDLSIKIDALERVIRDLFEKQWVEDLRRYESRLEGLLAQAEEGWKESDGGSRVWRKVAYDLNEYYEFYAGRLSEILSEQPANLTALCYFTERLRVVIQTRLQCLILNNEYASAIHFAKICLSRFQGIFDKVSPMSLFRSSIHRKQVVKKEEIEREACEMIPRFREFIMIIRELSEILNSRPYLIERLKMKNIDGREYIIEARQKEECPFVLV